MTSRPAAIIRCNFYIWSGMGCTPMVGLGLALARPDRRVAVITGDGDMLMGAGQPRDHRRQAAEKSDRDRLLDNGHYSASGMQPSAHLRGHRSRRRGGVPVAGRIVSTTGIAPTSCATLLHSGEGPLFIHARVDADDQKRIIPSRDGLGDQAALHAGVVEARVIAN